MWFWNSLTVTLDSETHTFIGEFGFTLLIDGVDYSGQIKVDTLRINSQLNSRDSMSFILEDWNGNAPNLEVGTEVLLMDAEDNRVYGGSISYVDLTIIPGTSIANYRVECVDYNELADRRLVYAVYENMTAGQIIRDIVDTFMPEEGLTYNHVQDGAVITRAVFNYNTVNSAFNEISEQTGFSWHIDANKDVHFFSRETNVAPFAVTTSSGNWRNLSVKRSKDRIRNVQYIRGGREASDPRTELFVGDGTRKTFTVSLPIATVPTVTVDGVSQTVGIRGLESGRDWYWNKEQNEISQDDAAVPLTGSNTLSITYQGFYPILALAEDAENISKRAEVENTSGRYEMIEIDGKVDSSNVAIDKANGLLRRHKEIPESVTFETDSPGLREGQLLTINVPQLGLNGQYQIERVSATEQHGKLFRYVITALSGESFGGWVSFFKALTTNKSDYVIRENEVLMQLASVSDAVRISDSAYWDVSAAGTYDFATFGYSQYT